MLYPYEQSVADDLLSPGRRQSSAGRMGNRWDESGVRDGLSAALIEV